MRTLHTYPMYNSPVMTELQCGQQLSHNAHHIVLSEVIPLYQPLDERDFRYVLQE